MTADLLASTKSKIKRAKKHFADLSAEIDAYLGRNPYRILLDKDSDAPKELHRFEFTETIPCHWGSMVGDVIHNLRSSLDTLATALAVLNGTTSQSVLRKTYFPIGSSKEFFERKLPDDLRGASAAARKFVEDLKPYKGGTDTFWQIHQLDILDKHTSLVPVGASNTHIEWKVDMAGHFGGVTDPKQLPDLPAIRLTPADRQFPLKNGDVIVSYTPGPEEQGKHKHEFKVTLTIAFGEGQIIDGQPLLPSLKQFIDFVTVTVINFDRNLFGG